MFSLFPKIELLIDQGRHAEAEAAIREELKTSMDNPFLFYLLALVLLSQEKPKAAEEAARESIRLEADYDMGFYILSRILLSKEKKRESLQAINEAIRIDPEFAAFFSQKAQIYLDWGKYEKSLQAAEEGLAIEPEHDGCRFFRSISLERLGRTEEAEAESLSLLSDDPEDAENHRVRGWVLAQRGDSEGAERHFIEALRIEPDCDDARAGLAFAFKMKRPVLGAVMRSLIWMERIPWWWLIIGIFVGMRLVDQLIHSDLPFPLPQVGSGIRIFVWSAFIVILLIQPLFNLVLQASKTARHALTNRERKGVHWSLVPIFIAFGYLGLWILKGGASMPPTHAIVWAALAKLIHEIFETENPWVSRRLVGVAVFAFAVVLWITYFTYGYLLPELFAMIRDSRLAEDDGEPPSVAVERLKRLMTLHQNTVYYPSVGLWIIAAFSSDIRGFFVRRSPD